VQPSIKTAVFKATVLFLFLIFAHLRPILPTYGLTTAKRVSTGVRWLLGKTLAITALPLLPPFSPISCVHVHTTLKPLFCCSSSQRLILPPLGSAPIHSSNGCLTNKSICWPTNSVWPIQQDAHQTCNF
jgi:hypothetical protein